VKYGPYLRNVMDLYRPQGTDPVPVLLYFHGGGFVTGDKSKVKKDLLNRCLDAGIAVVSANYRLILGPESAPFPAPMLDGARAIQFVRFKAKEWNLDPERVALAGSSAGGCMSVWLGVHDDLAKLEDEDPIGRLSTRVSCVIGYGAQTTLDPREVLREIGGKASIHPSLLPFYAARSREELDSPEKRALIEKATALRHVSPGDPAMQLRYAGTLSSAPLPAEASTNDSIHHAMFGKLLKDAYDGIGQTCEVVCDDLPEQRSEIAFLRACFGME